MTPNQGHHAVHGAPGGSESFAEVTDWRPSLRHAGLRVTKQRLAVLEALEATPHGTAEEILHTVRQDLPEITVQSIYTVIHSLVHVGILRKLDLPSSPSRYEPELHDNHHHAVCTSCGHIQDVECAVGDAPCIHPAGHHGMKIISTADVVYRGICESCDEDSPELTQGASSVEPMSA